MKGNKNFSAAWCAADQGIKMTNYGILIAHMQGILMRSIEPFPEVLFACGRTRSIITK